jgi:hypothetical protein
MNPSLSIAAFAAAWMASLMAGSADKQVKVVDFYTAADSQSSSAEIRLVTDQAGWKQAWSLYQMGPSIGSGSIEPAVAAPKIDFDKNEVVAIYSSLQPIAGFKISDLFLKGNVLHLRMQTVPQATGAVQISTNAVAFVVLPREKYPIDVEFPGGDSGWQLATELSAG